MAAAPRGCLIARSVLARRPEWRSNDRHSVPHANVVDPWTGVVGKVGKMGNF